MELNEGNLQTLAGYLQQTLSPVPTERRAGEKFLESIERNQNYPLLLLQLMDAASTPAHLRVSAAITLKNYVKRNWKITEEEGDKIHANDRALVKQNIVGLMLKSPEQIQKQLSDAISVIGKEDFPAKWPDLIQEMVGKFESGDFHVINGVLHTAHSLFKRYRHEFKSQALWTEIKFVLDNFALPLTQLFNATVELAKVHAENKDALTVIYSSLLLISKIFYSLNCQDIPEFFEDNMKSWMDHFLALLTTDNKLLTAANDEDPGLGEQLKTQICNNVTMYAQKYDEEFAPHLPAFVNAVWVLLTTLGNQVKFDLLVSNAIEFLATVAERPGYKQLFESPETLTSICGKIILPNMEFRDADEEAFEDNAEEYIRRDIEGSDVDTRRRAACDLVRALSKSFEAVIIQNFSAYIQHMLAEYAENPSKKWKSKDAAIFLVTSLAAKAQTQKHGITQTSELVNVVDFYQNHICLDLQSPAVNECPVLKADAIKYVMIFRNQLPQELLVAAIGPLTTLLTADSPVVHSYAACCLERLLTVHAAAGGVPAISKADLSPHSERLLTNLFQVLSRPGSQENEHAMKAIMRTLFLLQEVFYPHVGTIVTQLTEKLMAVSKNPSKPYFNHFLFESICISVSVTCGLSAGEAVGSFEEGLFPPFQVILQQDIQEFIPYVFQVLALLLEQRQDRVSDPYMALFPHLLLPVLWERQGNIPPLVRLLQAYVRRGWAQIGAEKLPPLLGIFQKLIASKANDHFAFSLLGTFIQHVLRDSLAQYMQQVFMLIFTRLQSSKTIKYVKGLLVFLSLYAVKYGASSLVSTLDQIQPKMFGMVVEKLFIADLQKVTGVNERKVCAVAVTQILTDCPAMLQADYSKLWCPLLQALVGLFELPSDTTATEDVAITADAGLDDASGFQVAYSQLTYGGTRSEDFCADVACAKQYLARALHKLCTVHPNEIKSMIAGGIAPESSQVLQSYLNAAGLQLV